MQTRETCGPSSDASSRSADLQKSLESRLRARMGAVGSLEYVLTWKPLAMPSGPPICALRASARPIGGSGSTGWPTPTVNDSRGGRNRTAKRSNPNSKHHDGLTLCDAVWGWSTPQANEPSSRERPSRKATGRTTEYLSRQVLGISLPLFDAPQTGGSAGLNPELSRWLMGFPAGWASFEATETASSPSLRQSS